MPERHLLRRPGGLWRHRDFMWLWGAQTVSQFGTQITFLALPLAAILVLDASAFEVALLGALEWTPWLILSLPAGAWVDRLPRRPILIAADVGRAGVLLSIPIAYAFGGLTIWQLYVVGFLAGVMTVFFDVAYQSYLPSLVGREHLEEGNSKLEISRSGAQLAGPGAAGALVELLTAPVAILVDAVSFLVSALMLGAIRRPEEAVERAAATRLRVEILEGVRYVLGNPYLRPSMAFVAVANFFGQVMFSIMLVYLVRELGLSAAAVGLAFGISNAGFLAGAALCTRISRRVGIGRTLVASAALGGWPLLLVPLAPREAIIPVLVVALGIVSFAGVTYNVVGLSLFQAITPDRLLGRMNASRRFVVWGVIPLGALAGGVLATTLGTRPTLFVGAIGASLAFLPVLFSPVRSLVRVEDARAPAAAAHA